MVRAQIVCIADTHGYSPEDAALKFPKGDVLIHAGDLTRHGTLAELRRTVEWLEKGGLRSEDCDCRFVGSVIYRSFSSKAALRFMLMLYCQDNHDVIPLTANFMPNMARKFIMASRSLQRNVLLFFHTLHSSTGIMNLLPSAWETQTGHKPCSRCLVCLAFPIVRAK
ncbi:hypothetical protein VTO42DRAFT_8148 [Malbranchea cinnamomea]